MRPQGIVLEHHADAALVRGHVVDHAIAEADFPLVGVIETREEPEQGGFAAARRTEEGEHLALRDGKADLADRRQRPETFREVLDRDAHGSGGLPDYFFFNSSATDSMSLRNCELTCS